MGEGETKKVQVVCQRVPLATAGALTEEQLAEASNVELIKWREVASSSLMWPGTAAAPRGRPARAGDVAEPS